MFQFSYVLDGSGWATVTIRCENDVVTMGASYLCDSLRDFGEAVLKLNCCPNSSAIFMEEPGEYHVEFNRSDSDVAIRIEWFDDWKSWGLPFQKSEPRFVGTVSLAYLRSELVRVMDELLHKWGIRGYKRRWVAHPFPLETLNRLRIQT